MPPENKAPQKPMRRRMVSTQLYAPSEGQTTVGRLTEKGTQTLQGKEVGRYVLTNEAATIIVNGTVQLDEAFAKVQEGDMIELLYLGTAPTSNGFNVKRFEVYVLEDDESDG